jgi:hypothetical protein
MQPEGPNKSEERLQRYAKERRQRGDFSLHPATRRLLQGEVVRQYGSRTKEERARLTWFGLWRGRFAVGGALVAVLITTCWIFFNGPVKKQSRMELADAKIPAPEKNVALESDRLALGDDESGSAVTTSGKAIAAIKPATVRGEPANKPAPTRSRALDGLVANELQLGAKLETNTIALALNAQERGEAFHYFADLNSTLPTTNSGITALSAVPIDLWGQSPLAPALQTKPSGNVDAGAVAGWSINAVAAGATNSALLAENSERFYKLNPQLPQVALQNGFDESKRLQETAQLMKAQPQVAYRNVAEPSAIAPQSIAAPAAPAQLSADNSGLGESLARSQAVGQQLNVEARSAFGASGTGLSRADVNNNQTFFRQIVVPAETVAGNVKQLEDLASKKSEETVGSQVLSEFTIEQRGNSVRLMDFDGSVYDGVIDAPVVTESEKLKEDSARDKDGYAVNRALREAAGGRAGETNQAPEYSFRASGSNVTLRQSVVVNGRFRHSTNANNASLDRRGAGAAGTNLQKAPAPTDPLATRRTLERFGRAAIATDSTPAIEGTLQVGPTNVQRFLAVPGTRQ